LDCLSIACDGLPLVDRLSFDLIIFDCDGVLVDSEPIVNRLFVDMLAELGLTLDYEATLREFCGGAMSARLETIQRRHRREVAAQFADDFNRRLEDTMRGELRPVPGAREALHGLRWRKCVASNGTCADIRFRLGMAGLLGYFEPHLFSGAELGRPKPAPDVFLHAARTMGVSPRRCVVIEDSSAGVRAGLAAGMTVFGFTRLTPPELLAGVNGRLFERMADLPTILESL
jgi:HAD superfamily hydrolase (TIGR01509 family)